MSYDIDKIKELIKLMQAIGGIYMINRANDKNE